MSLVDDIEGEAAEDKRLSLCRAETESYFYIVIDHAAEGENKVHFLNQVDEADLLAIIESRGNRSPACRMQLYRQMRNGQNQYGLPRLQRCYE